MTLPPTLITCIYGSSPDLWERDWRVAYVDLQCQWELSLALAPIRRTMAIRWGICSAGNISHDFVVALKSSCVANHKVVAVGARSKESAAKFAETHNIPNSYGSYEEVAEDPEVPWMWNIWGRAWAASRCT